MTQKLSARVSFVVFFWLIGEELPDARRLRRIGFELDLVLVFLFPAVRSVLAVHPAVGFGLFRKKT